MQCQRATTQTTLQPTHQPILSSTTSIQHLQQQNLLIRHNSELVSIIQDVWPPTARKKGCHVIEKPRAGWTWLCFGHISTSDSTRVHPTTIPQLLLHHRKSFALPRTWTISFATHRSLSGGFRCFRWTWCLAVVVAFEAVRLLVAGTRAGQAVQLHCTQNISWAGQ